MPMIVPADGKRHGNGCVSGRQKQVLLDEQRRRAKIAARIEGLKDGSIPPEDYEEKQIAVEAIWQAFSI